MTLRRPVDEHDWIRGAPDATVTLVEYGDFECPHCARAHHQLKRLEAWAGDRFALVFRHFPIAQLHPHAQLAAEAAEAAGAQRRFWEMHDLIFEREDGLDASALLQFAANLRLDLKEFNDALREHHYVSKPRRDFMEGVRSGVNGTPTFFVNGARYQGPHTADAFLALIEGRAMPDSDVVV